MVVESVYSEDVEGYEDSTEVVGDDHEDCEDGCGGDDFDVVIVDDALLGDAEVVDYSDE